MKHITSMIITISMLASLAMVSCNNKTQEPANTADTTTPAVTTEAVSTTAETDAETTVEGTTEPVEKPFDVDAFLADCTVYDVTVETQHSPLDELQKLTDTDKPKKIALKYTDADNLMLLMNLVATEYNVYSYYVTHIVSSTFNIPVSSGQFGYNYVGFNAKFKNGTTLIENSNGHGTVCQYYIINSDVYYMLENSASESGYALYLYITDNGEIVYDKISSKYHVQNFEAFLTAYESDEDFYKESGRLVFENGNIDFNSDKVTTIGDGHEWSELVNRFCKEYNVSSTKELAKLYEQYLSEGKGREFMESVR